MKPRQADLTRQAVAIMTAWVDSGEDSALGIKTLTDILQERDRHQLRCVDPLSGTPVAVGRGPARCDPAWLVSRKWFLDRTGRPRL
jgi:hypothetical protein